MSNNNSSQNDSTRTNTEINSVDQQLEDVGYQLKDITSNNLNNKNGFSYHNLESRCKILDCGTKSYQSTAGYKLKESDLTDMSHLQLSIYSGSEFKDQKGASKNSKNSLKQQIIFGRQKFTSLDQDLEENPKFNEMHQLIVQDHNCKKIDANSLCTSQLPIEILLQEIDENNLKKLLSAKKIEWRFALSEFFNGKLNLNVKLCGIGTKNDTTIGQMKIEIKLNNISGTVPNNIIQEQLTHEINEDKCFINECQKLSDKFYLSLENKNLEVKLWAESIFDQELRPIFEFCQPLNPDHVTRVFETPLHCLRFVSLIPTLPFGKKSDIVLDPKVFLTLGHGSSAEHSLLLCSLLLSFSLNAQVVVGSSKRTVQGVIVILNRNKSEDQVIEYWDPQSGDRCKVNDQDKIKKQMSNVSCLFNDNILQALNQSTDLIYEVDWRIKSDAWKEFTWVEAKERQDDKFNLVDRLNMSIYPIQGPQDLEEYTIYLEKNMYDYILSARKTWNLKTEFNQKLGYVLSQVACNLEFEKISGNSFGHEEFQSSISKLLSGGFKFKAIPLHIKSNNTVDNIIVQLNNSNEVKEIIKMDKPGLKFCVRCKVQSQPENIRSVWIIIASCCREN